MAALDNFELLKALSLIELNYLIADRYPILYYQVWYGYQVSYLYYILKCTNIFCKKQLKPESNLLIKLNI